MVFRCEWDLIECKMRNLRLKFLSKSPSSWFGLLELFFPASCPNETHFFLIGIHSTQGWTATVMDGVNEKKKHRKTKAHRKSL